MQKDVGDREVKKGEWVIVRGVCKVDRPKK